MVVMDGQEGKAYEGIGALSLSFSPDGKRSAYIARRGQRQLIVIDGAGAPTAPASARRAWSSAPTAGTWPGS